MENVKNKTERVRERPVRVNEVMKITGYTRSYIYKLVYWKKIPCHKPTNGTLFFFETEIIDFLSRGRQAANYELEEKADSVLNGEH